MHCCESPEPCRQHILISWSTVPCLNLKPTYVSEHACMYNCMHACSKLCYCSCPHRKPKYRDISECLPRRLRYRSSCLGSAVAVLHASRILRSVILLSSLAADTVVDAISISRCNPTPCCLQLHPSHVLCSCVVVLLCFNCYVSDLTLTWSSQTYAWLLLILAIGMRAKF